MGSGYGCEACGASSRSARRLCLHCGVEAVGPVEDEAVTEALPYADITEEPDEELVPCRAAIARALGGVVPRSGNVLVGGEPGAGKSTEVARICCALGWRAVYLDAEMSAPEWRNCFRDATPRQLERVRRVKSLDGWPGAIRALRDLRPPLAVVDSLHRHARSDAERLTFLQELRAFADAGALVFVICQVNAKGEIAGLTALEHEARATVLVDRENIVGLKCRWAAESTAPRLTLLS